MNKQKTKGNNTHQVTWARMETFSRRGGGSLIPGPSGTSRASPMTWRNRSCSSRTRQALFIARWCWQNGRKSGTPWDRVRGTCQWWGRKISYHFLYEPNSYHKYYQVEHNKVWVGAVNENITGVPRTGWFKLSSINRLGVGSPRRFLEIRSWNFAWPPDFAHVFCEPMSTR